MNYRLKRDGDRPLVFEGEIVAEVSTRNRRIRWTELRLYEIVDYGAEFVAEQVGRTDVEGELDRCKAFVCADSAGVRDAMGDGPLARQLYTEAGFDGVEDLRDTKRKQN